MAKQFLKVRFLKDLAGADSSFMQGERCDLPEDLARKFAAAETVELIDDDELSDDEPAGEDPLHADGGGAGLETTMLKGGRETTALRRGRPR